MARARFDPRCDDSTPVVATGKGARDMLVKPLQPNVYRKKGQGYNQMVLANVSTHIRDTSGRW